MRWYLITGEYPPQRGGVADHSRAVADRFAALGDRVDAWAPGSEESDIANEGVQVHRLPSHFGPAALRVLSRNLAKDPERRILVQYVPHAFGFKSLNLPFSWWLYSHRRLDITTVFHEVTSALKIEISIRRSAQGIIHRTMATLVARASKRIFVTVPAWTPMIRSMVGERPLIKWLPVPSNIPVTADRRAGSLLRPRYAHPEDLLLGHFGNNGGAIANAMVELAPLLLKDSPDRRLLLIGLNARALQRSVGIRYPGLAAQVHAASDLVPADVSEHLMACDLMVQPYTDGVSSRRSSVMAALSHGIPVATTVGRVTEAVWKDGAVGLAPASDWAAVANLTDQMARDEALRIRIGQIGRALYASKFDLSHTVAALREDANCSG